MGGGEGEPTVSLRETSEIAVRPESCVSLGLSKGEPPLLASSGEGVALVPAVKVIVFTVEVVLATLTVLLLSRELSVSTEGALGVFGITPLGLLTVL